MTNEAGSLHPFRHGNHNPRNIYFVGGNEHVAVVVGVDEVGRARFFVEALNAYWAAGHRPASREVS